MWWHQRVLLHTIEKQNTPDTGEMQVGDLLPFQRKTLWNRQENDCWFHSVLQPLSSVVRTPDSLSGLIAALCASVETQRVEPP